MAASFFIRLRCDSILGSNPSINIYNRYKDNLGNIADFNTTLYGSGTSYWGSYDNTNKTLQIVNVSVGSEIDISFDTFNNYLVTNTSVNSTLVTNRAVFSVVSIDISGLLNGTIAPDDFLNGLFSGGSSTSNFSRILQPIDTSMITAVGNNFCFRMFTGVRYLTQIPSGSFNLNNIKSVGDNFMSRMFNDSSVVTLPAGSFNTANITSYGSNFLFEFNRYGSLDMNLTSPNSIYITNITNSNIIFNTPNHDYTVTPTSTISIKSLNSVYTRLNNALIHRMI